MQFKPYQAIPLNETLQAYDAMDEDTVTAQKTTVANPMYYYHPDHLGTSTALTDINGEPYQFFLNLPFGETMAEQLGSHYYNSPYKFNGKELDEETGLYYYGARYYDPRVSNWLSVDPLAEKFPNASPYNYCLDNPINLIDPDGMAPGDPIGPGYYSASINSRYIGFGVTKGATNISTNATRFATRGEVLNGSKRGQTDEGSENGAYRHTLWQASITSEFGSKTAIEAGNAHEENPFTSLKNRSFKSIADADQTADLLNNMIGRGIGEENKEAGMDDLANLVLDEFKNNGLYTSSKNKDGNWNISKTKLSSDKYYTLKGIFKGLNENGRNQREQKDIDDKALKDIQSYDRGSKW